MNTSSGNNNQIEVNFASRLFTNSIFRLVVTFGGFFYFAVLFYIFFLARRRRGPSHAWDETHLHLVPLRDKFVFFIGESGKVHPDLHEFYIDLFGNILLFIPFAFLFYFFFRVRQPLKSMLVSIVISISIEFIQFALGIGVADIDDIMLNTLGAYIGVLLLQLVLRKVKI